METRYPTPRVTHLLRVLAAKGKRDAQIILDIVQACQETLEGTNGLDSALGIVRDADDVLNGVIDDVMPRFLAIFIERAGSFENLYWHVNIREVIRAAVLFRVRMGDGSYPKEVCVHHEWRAAMQDENTIVVNDVVVPIFYSRVGEDGKKIKDDPMSRLHVWTR